jgi:ubiquinone/menaquinone biosynthesis C-methylase UbiE
MDKYQNDIDRFWGTQWSQRIEPIDFTNNVALFKFRYFIKPVLDVLPYGAKICEVGVGLGSWLFLCKSYRPDLRLYGADLSEFVINHCISSGINCVKSDTRDLPFQDSEFDAVFSWGVVEHMLDSHLAVKEQFRVAKSYLILDVPFGPSLAHISTRRAIASRKLSDYDAMIEFGRFFDKETFKKLVFSSIPKSTNVTFMNNYLMLPGRLTFLERYIPSFVRSKFGHNIGAIIKKN